MVQLIHDIKKTIFLQPKQLTSGLYYKHMTIVNGDSSIISKWSFKLIDDARVVIYDHNMFIKQSTY
jgi:hypothetical protein